MPALLTFITPYLEKVLPVLVLGVTALVYVFKIKSEKRKETEDRMRNEKAVSDNQTSQLSAVQTVEQDMGQKTTGRPSPDTTAGRFKDGTF